MLVGAPLFGSVLKPKRLTFYKWPIWEMT